MQLVGMRDSPYARRTAISLALLGLQFESHPISEFSGMDAFRAINPVVKAPTLVADESTVLMDSKLILRDDRRGLKLHATADPDHLPAGRFPLQAAFATQAEALPTFKDWQQV